MSVRVCVCSCGWYIFGSFLSLDVSVEEIPFEWRIIGLTKNHWRRYDSSGSFCFVFHWCHFKRWLTWSVLNILPYIHADFIIRTAALRLLILPIYHMCVCFYSLWFSFLFHRRNIFAYLWNSQIFWRNVIQCFSVDVEYIYYSAIYWLSLFDSFKCY